MSIDRRTFLRRSLGSALGLSLRASLIGVPASFLLNRSTHAADAGSVKYTIFSGSSAGETWTTPEIVNPYHDVDGGYKDLYPRLDTDALKAGRTPNECSHLFAFIAPAARVPRRQRQPARRDPDVGAPSGSGQRRASPRPPSTWRRSSRH